MTATESFFRKFGEEIAERINADSVLDKLFGRGILTREEREDKIKNLSTRGNRRVLLMLLMTKDASILPEFVQVLEEATSGQPTLIKEMKIYLKLPVNAPEMLQNTSRGTVADSITGPKFGMNDDMNFKVTFKMTTDIRNILKDDGPCIEKWSEVCTSFLSQPTDKLKVKRMLKDDNYAEAIYYTISAWTSYTKAEDRTFQNLLNTLKIYKLENAIEALKLKADDIRKIGNKN